MKRRRHSFRARHNRRNPQIAGFQANELVKLAVGAAGGAIGTKYLTQLVLQDKNVGATGYAVSALAAIALGWAAAKFAGREVATGVVAGGLSAVLLRIWQEQVSGSMPMSGLGDSDMLGLYGQGTYAAPFWSYGGGALPAAPTAALTMVTPGSVNPSKRGGKVTAALN